MISFFFFNDTATTEIYTLSLHDALPILPMLASVIGSRSTRSSSRCTGTVCVTFSVTTYLRRRTRPDSWLVLPTRRSEEHTSELQSRQYIVWRLLLEKKKRNLKYISINNA